MKLNFLAKFLPFISTLVLIILLFISNQKENTRLKILIWNTPSYSLGTYLATSTGIGFILSYLLTTNIANINRFNTNKPLKYKYKNSIDDSSEYSESSFRVSNEKTLIERDINEPSPTVNAQFRVIGKTEKYPTDDIEDRIEYDNRDDYEQSSFEQDDKTEFINTESYNQEKKNFSDWYDDSFLTW